MALHQVADQARGLHDPGRGDRGAQDHDQARARERHGLRYRPDGHAGVSPYENETETPRKRGSGLFNQALVDRSIDREKGMLQPAARDRGPHV